MATWISKGTKGSLSPPDIHGQTRSDCLIEVSLLFHWALCVYSGLRRCIMNTSVILLIFPCSFFSCLHFFPPLCPHPIIIPTLFPHPSLLLWLSCFPTHLSSSSHVDPPPVPPCRIITTSPRGPPSAPCISLTRGADVEVTTASSRRRWCLQTGLERSTFTFTSRTGSRLMSPSAWEACTLQLQLDPEAHSRHDPQSWETCVWTVFSMQILPLRPTWRHETAVGQNKLLLWRLARCLSSLAGSDHCIIAAQSLNNVLEV